MFLSPQARLIVCLSWPSPRISHFSKDSVYWSVAFGAKVLYLLSVCALLHLCLSDPLSRHICVYEPMERYASMCAHIHANTHIYSLACASCCSVAQSCPNLCNPMNRSTPGLPVYHQLPEFKLKSIELVMPSSHLIPCHPLLLLPPIPPSIRVFSSESVLHIR